MEKLSKTTSFQIFKLFTHGNDCISLYFEVSSTAEHNFVFYRLDEQNVTASITMSKVCTLVPYGFRDLKSKLTET